MCNCMGYYGECYCDIGNLIRQELWVIYLLVYKKYFNYFFVYFIDIFCYIII